MRKIIELLDKHADGIILLFIKMCGYFCLFVNGIYFGQTVDYGFNGWAFGTMIVSFVAFVLSRIFVNLIERKRRNTE